MNDVYAEKKRLEAENLELKLKVAALEAEVKTLWGVLKPNPISPFLPGVQTYPIHHTPFQNEPYYHVTCKDGETPSTTPCGPGKAGLGYAACHTHPSGAQAIGGELNEAERLGHGGQGQRVVDATGNWVPISSQNHST